MNELSELARKLNLPEDDPLLLLARSNAELESKVGIWSATIIQVLELVKLQNEQANLSAKQSGRLSNSLEQFRKELLIFNQQSQEQKKVLGKLKPVSVSLEQISQALKRLEAKQAELIKQNTAILKGQVTGSGNRRLLSSLPYLLGGVLGIVVAQGIQLTIMQGQLSTLSDQLNQTLIRLDDLKRQ